MLPPLITRLPAGQPLAGAGVGVGVAAGGGVEVGVGVGVGVGAASLVVTISRGTLAVSRDASAEL
jgi:hypothetical protein